LPVTTVLPLFSSPGGVALLVCGLLSGAGLRPSEALSLRVTAADFLRREALARDGKGQKDRATMLPAAAREPLRAHLDAVRRLHQRDRSRGPGAPPDALARKDPAADREWGRQWVLPASSRYVARRTGRRHRHHVQEAVVQRAVQEAVGRAGPAEPARCHTFRPCFAAHRPEDGDDIRTVPELPGQKDAGTTVICTHVLNRGGKGCGARWTSRDGSPVSLSRRC
jgi:site-specific recombinase XerD